jgi:hypothetical protein
MFAIICNKQIIVISLRFFDGYITLIIISMHLPTLVVTQKAGTSLEMFTLNDIHHWLLMKYRGI